MASVSRCALPPRPSVSLLSNTSISRNDFLHTLDHEMRRKLKDDEAVEAVAPPEIVDAEVGEQRDDRSSSLSDPEDEHDGSEAHDEVDGETLDGEQSIAQRSLEVDSEAETERLDQTPQKQRKHPDNLGRTPSKLSQTATADEDLSEPPSPIPAGAGAASSTSTIATTGKSRY